MTAPVYLPDRTFVVTHVNGNYLVRGNEPLLADEKTFAYDALNTRLQALIGGTFNLTHYKLIDIPLIDDNPNSERALLEAEFKAYGITPTQFDATFPWPQSWPPALDPKLNLTTQYGTSVSGHPGAIIWYPVQGCTSMSNCALVEPTQFKFTQLVVLLHTLLHATTKTVIYYHCEHGHDRTSALTAAYMMKYMGKSLNDVLTEGPPNGAKAFKHHWEPTYKQLVEYYYATVINPPAPSPTPTPAPSADPA
ncbi:dual specificity protein phosphatase family protein [Andreprevotia chitinilytica]|uniref:dual specificity protein phosphatase family protein n=1 Tax=Andreprevotia chitinilytica TaxID=396808 RepID=UPI0005552A15|nr:dual specificity protein phosphatase family protein [Andreprevotia chitinilytica]